MMSDEFPKPERKDGREPCGECHLRAGEACDICGAILALTAHSEVVK